MARLSTLLRVALILMTATMVLWLASLAAFYRTQPLGRDLPPAPARVAAIAAVLEAAPAAQRAGLVAALGTDQLSLRLAAGAPAPGAPKAPQVEEALRRAYAAALAPRPLVISDPPGRPAARAFPRLWHAAWNAFELQVGLNGGGTLVLVARPRVLLAPLGLPLGFPVGMVGTLIALAALIVMHRATRPLLRLAAAAERVGTPGDPVALPDVRRSAPEVRALVEAFDRLQTRVADLLQARMALLGGIAHDVRTFATRLRLRLDLIPDPAERARAEADIADMIGLLDAALLASRAGALELGRELIDLAPLVAAEVDDRRAHGARVQLVAPPADLAVLGDRLALRRALANLIDNALHYGQEARVSLRAAAGMALLQVDDSGPGIPEAQRRMLLEPFTRLDSSRNRRTGGAGLGLAVVRALAEAMEGRVTIADAPGGGARVTLALPVFTPG